MSARRMTARGNLPLRSTLCVQRPKRASNDDARQYPDAYDKRSSNVLIGTQPRCGSEGRDSNLLGARRMTTCGSTKSPCD